MCIRDRALDEQTSDFIYELEHIRMQDSGGLFDQFLQNTTISMVELYTADGVLMETPSNQNDFNDGITGEALGGTSYESAPIISNSYYFSFADDNSQYILTVYGEASQIAELRQSFVSVLPILFCVILLVSLATAWGYSRIITNPVLKISRISKEMSDMRLEWQLEERRSDELGVLENSLNTLSRKLSATLEELQSANLQLQKDIEHQKALERAQQDFFSSASHELKTPLSGLRILLENMQYNIGKYKDRDKYLAEAVAKVDELSGMVRDILDTSKVQDLQEEEKQKLYAGGEIGTVLQEYAMQIADKKLEVTDSIPEDCMLFMSRNTFQKVWSNLIGNAVQYTEQGGQITIAADTDKIWIENSCTPLTEEQLAYIYEPFYRVDDTRAASGGNGLGLYVVRELLKKEGFRHVFEPVEDGMRFTIFL